MAAADEPLRLENDAGQTLALAGTAEALGAAVRPSFGETADTLRAAESPAGAVPGHTRIEDAATWSAAIRESQRATARRFVENGALVEDPETLWADPTCEAGPGARIGASVRLTGSTRIAGGAEVQSFCRLENTEVEAGARILSHSVLLDSSIGRDAKVGPFAHIRPNTRLEPESFAGSFVETKNAVLARRAALPHLSYVGDADVGVRANLGAGTITCNYDGRGKVPDRGGIGRVRGQQRHSGGAGDHRPPGVRRRRVRDRRRRPRGRARHRPRTPGGEAGPGGGPLRRSRRGLSVSASAKGREPPAPLA